MKVYRTPNGEKKTGIYVRDDSPYLWIGYTYRKKRKFENTKTNKFKEAQRLLDERKDTIRAGKFTGRKLEDITLMELSEDYLRDYRVNERKSLDRAEKSVEHLLNYFEVEKLAVDVTTDDISKYRKSRMKDKTRTGNSPALSTINRELAALKRMFHLAYRATPPKVGRIPYIPIARENNTRKGFFRRDEFLALKSALPRHWRAFVTTAYWTGMRAGELRSLTWDQVDLERRTISLHPGETKNDEARVVFMSEELYLTLAEQEVETKKIYPDCIWVFHVRGGHISAGGYRKAWKGACKEIGLSGRLFHDLRRTGARNLIRAGIPERVAMAITGHKTRSVFERYNIVSEDDLREAAQKQDAVLKRDENVTFCDISAEAENIANRKNLQTPIIPI